MGVRILTDAGKNESCMYCSTTMWAFGPIFEEIDLTNDKGDKVIFDSEDATQQFLAWLKSKSTEDPRTFKDNELESHKADFDVAIQKGDWPPYVPCEECEGEGTSEGLDRKMRQCPSCVGKGEVPSW